MMELNVDQKNSLIELIETRGWQTLQEIFADEIYKLRIPKNISKKKRFEDIAIDVIAKTNAGRRLERMVKDINNVKQKPKLKTESFV